MDMVIRASASSPSETRLLEGRHGLGEGVEPGDELGMRFAPFSLEAKILIAERAGKRDPPGIRDAS